MSELRTNFSIGQWVTLACQLECSIPKIGNVHRGADFDDTSFYDFLVSGQILGSVMDGERDAGLGGLVLRSVERTLRTVGKNTNLGIVLCLVPLALAARKTESETSAVEIRHVQTVLDHLGPEDARQVFEAIRMANPGGLGAAQKHDVQGAAPDCLIEAMQEAADRDRVALQYVTNFANVFESGVPWLKDSFSQTGSLVDATILLHVRMIGEWGDSLIGRKAGWETFRQAQVRAQQTWELWDHGDADGYHFALEELDFWMRSDGRNRNPGTTADLVAATLFVGLFNGHVPLKF